MVFCQHVCLCLWRSEEGVRSSGTVDTAGGELPNGYQGWNPGPPEVQSFACWALFPAPGFFLFLLPFFNLCSYLMCSLSVETRRWPETPGTRVKTVVNCSVGAVTKIWVIWKNSQVFSTVSLLSSLWFCYYLIYHPGSVPEPVVRMLRFLTSFSEVSLTQTSHKNRWNHLQIWEGNLLKHHIQTQIT